MPASSGVVLELVCATHPGRVRSQNEDSIGGDAQAGFAALADGMGGHNAGEVASRMAVELVSSAIRSELSRGEPLDPHRAESLIARQVAMANATVLEAASAHPKYRGMGTTLVLVLWHGSWVTYGHVGDSRLYRLRDSELEQLTRDHSLVQEQLERGVISREQARRAVNRNVLTRAVGIDPEVEVEIRTLSTHPRDLYLLCSDGLTDMMSDEKIGEVLLSAGVDLTVAAARLIDEANEAGGFDNVSVVLARVAGGPLTRQK